MPSIEQREVGGMTLPGREVDEPVALCPPSTEDRGNSEEIG